MRLVAMLALTLVMIGCRPAPPPAPPPPPAEPTVKAPMLFVHRVTFSGQTLSSIAKWYTGDASNWRQMVDPVNTGLTECCARLKVGRVIYVPRDLVTQTKAMPLPKTQTRPAKPLVKDEAKPEAEKAEEPAKDEPEKAEEPKAEPTAAPKPSKEADEAELPDDAPPAKAEPTAAPEPPAAGEDEEILGPR